MAVNCFMCCLSILTLPFDFTKLLFKLTTLILKYPEFLFHFISLLNSSQHTTFNSSQWTRKRSLQCFLHFYIVVGLS